MSNQSYEDQVKQAELELERDMKIFSHLKSVRIASDGRPVKIVAMGADVEAHIKKFSLKKVASFQRSDPRVVGEARRLAQKRDNTLMIVRTDSGFDLYNMMEESEIQASYIGSHVSDTSSSSPPQGQGCLIAIVVGFALIIVIWGIVAMSGNPPASPQQAAAPQGTTVGTMRAVSAIQLNMRSGPSTQYPVVRVFKQNERIVTIGESQNVNGEQWIQASTPDGQTRGWVNRKLVKP